MGYTIVNFALMYFIGAYQKIYGNKRLSDSNILYIVLLFINVSIFVGWTIVNDRTGFFSERSAEEYCNPIIIGLAIIYFRIFSNIDLGSNKIINELSKGSFTVFLLHYSFLKQINIEKIVQLKLPIMLICMFVSVIGIYLFCWAIYKIYNKTIYRLVKLITFKFSFLNKDIYEGCFEKYIEGYKM